MKARALMPKLMDLEGNFEGVEAAMLGEHAWTTVEDEFLAQLKQTPEGNYNSDDFTPLYEYKSRQEIEKRLAYLFGYKKPELKSQ